MKKIYLLFATLLLAAPSFSQTVLFTDDFESGTANWTLTGTFGLSQLYANTAVNSLTESPTGNYPDMTVMTATMNSGVNLSSALSADVSFYAIYDLEANFDYTYVEVSSNGGTTWSLLGTFTGDNQLSPWIQYTYSLGGYVGMSDVRIRFRFESDQGVNEDGMYIDDVIITSYNTDNAPPLIIHTAPSFYESTLAPQNLVSRLVDVSGISNSELHYKVDNGPISIINGVNTTGDTFVFTVPQQTAGSWVEYYIKATDNSTALNTDSTGWRSYITGNYIKYDNAQVDFVNSFGPAALGGTGAAVRITLPGTTDLVTALIRNYTDPNRPNDSMLVHIWSNNAGYPGVDLVTPFKVKPEATLANPNAMTRIDLRPYAAQLSGLSGDIFVGFTVPVNEVWVQQTTPGIANRTYAFVNGVWTIETDDYHFRVITGAIQGAPQADYSYLTANDPQIVFTDQTTGSPTSWLWDFDDGTTSTQQDPVHTFTENRTFNVCLTATNSMGTSTTCKLITINQVPPTAMFTWDAQNDPAVSFTETSPDVATGWLWDFGDGVQDSQQNPVHTFTSNGSFNVCLTIFNANGTSTPYCDTVTVLKVGLAENTLPKGVIVGPNPVHESLNILAMSPIKEVVVMDAAGRVVYQAQVGANQLYINEKFTTGIYLLRLTLDDGSSGSIKLLY